MTPHAKSFGLIRHADGRTIVGEKAIRLARVKADLGLQALTSLADLEIIARKDCEKEDPQILISIIAFTDASDPWTSLASARRAGDLVGMYPEQGLITSEFLADSLLRDLIRPLFSKSKPTAITSTGRKAMPTSAPSRRFEAVDLDPKSKPWKYEAVYAVTVFSWAVSHAEVCLPSPYSPRIIQVNTTNTTSHPKSPKSGPS